MNSTEFRTIREGLGLTAEFLADHLSINPRTVERWEAGTSPVPAFAVDALEMLEAQAAETVEHEVDLMNRALSPVMVIVSGPDEMPARWQRAVAFRVRERVPALRIVQAGPGARGVAARRDPHARTVLTTPKGPPSVEGGASLCVGSVG